MGGEGGVHKLQLGTSSVSLPPSGEQKRGSCKKTEVAASSTTKTHSFLCVCHYNYKHFILKELIRWLRFLCQWAEAQKNKKT